jgi:hypothetical protein
MECKLNNISCAWTRGLREGEMKDVERGLSSYLSGCLTPSIT